MRLHRLRGVTLSFFMILAIATAWGADGGGAPLPKVTFVHPVIREISDNVGFIGRTVAAARVEVRSRVTGTLLKANFKEGATVKEGDLLFEIDPQLYRDKMDSAEAAVAVAEARHDMVAAQEKRAAKARMSNLREVSDDDYANLVLKATVAKAELRMAQAKLAAARFDVDSSRVVAPISGRIGRRYVDPGNIVTGDQTILAVILSEDPLRVSFDIDQGTILKLRKATQEGQFKGDKWSVAIGTSNEAGLPHSGVVDFTDNEVHPETGTIRARAVLPNQDKLLLPGMNVTVQLTVSAPRKAVMVPEKAVDWDGSSFVFIINKQNVLQLRRINARAAQDEMREVIGGLSVEDRVVTGRLGNMAAGILVQPEEQAQPAPKPQK